MPSASSVHEFGSFRLDSADRLLLRAGKQVSLTPKTFDLLCILVGHAGRLVTKQELMNALWPDTVVEESNLTFTVSALRKALGDGQDGEQYITTVPTRGYRFVAPVVAVVPDELERASSEAGIQAPRIRRLVARLAAVGLLVGLIAAAILLVVSGRRDVRRLPSRFSARSSSYADPRWTNRQQLVATRWEPVPQAIVQISLNGNESVIETSAVNNMVESVSHDGLDLLFRQRGQRLLARPLGDGSKAIVIHEIPRGAINQAQFSPDKRWVVYQQQDETGKHDVWVTPYPRNNEREREQLSSGGGVQPVWRQDGRELYYLGMDGTLYAVELRSGNRPRFSAPKPLFTTGLVPPALTVEEYAVSRDGQRFLLLRPIEDRAQTTISVLFNWPALLTSTGSR